MTHHIKILPIHYEEIKSGRKKFEIRYNDKNYKIGDIVELEEFLGIEEIPSCPDKYSCEGKKYDERQGKYNPCPLGRKSCQNYTKEIYSGKRIYVKITDIFDISDIMKENIMDKFIAFTFKIINIKERKK